MIWTEKRDSRSLFYMCMIYAWGRISQDMGLGMSQGLDTFSRICSGSVTAALCRGRQIQRCCATSPTLRIGAIIIIIIIIVILIIVIIINNIMSACSHQSAHAFGAAHFLVQLSDPPWGFQSGTESLDQFGFVR